MARSMILQDLIEGLGLRVVIGQASMPVSGLSEDSRTVCPGDVFVARGGSETDGIDYVTEATRRGAVAVIADRPAPVGDGLDRGDGCQIAWVCGPQIDSVLVGRLAERFFGHPSEKLKLVGVTGTNGKTTTAIFLQHLLLRSGLPCGLIGTVWVDDGVQRRTATLTTPGPVAFSSHLAAMVANGCQAAVAEVSSHALDQGRVAAIRFNAGIFTNLTGDHLDYHQSMEQYAAAKAKLFHRLSAQDFAVINADDAYGQQVVRGCKAHVIPCRVNSSPPAQARPKNVCWASVVKLSAEYSLAKFEGPWGSVEARLPLAGKHNVANMLQAMAAADRLVDLSLNLRELIESCPAVPGRLERVQVGDQSDALPVVLVDYAHTHDALQNVLMALRGVTRGRLSVVFGCGGDRDQTKRPKMAAVACRWADRVVVTTDNARFEDPDRIISHILAGVPSRARWRVAVQPDRARAIAMAIGQARLGDTVLLAGKGHEDYQVMGSKKLPFSDREHAQAVLRQWGCHQGLSNGSSPDAATGRRGTSC